MKMKMLTFARNQTTGQSAGRNEMRGPAGPPRNSVTHSADIVSMFMYSDRKKMANRMPVYSVWNPPTSYFSASTRSKGARLVSATAARNKKTHATGGALQ